MRPALSVLGLAILLLAAPPVHAQRPTADLACVFTGTAYVYDCTIRLSRGGRPLDGVEITVGVEMPSMPMAHHVKPVTAKPGQAPGEYELRLALEMLGEWAVKLRLRGPVREQLILHYDFDATRASPAPSAGQRPRP